MLTGVAPFTANSPVSVAYKHVREAPTPPSQLVHDLPPAMDRIVLTALAKDVELRYQSAQDFRADLQRFERGRPLIAAPGAAAPTPTSVHVAAPVVPAPAAARAAAPQPAPARRKRGRWGAIVVIGIALALLLALIVFLLANSNFGDSGPSKATEEVPGAIGFPYGQAEAALKAKGFTVARKDVDEPDQPPDLVIGQDPEGGRKLEVGGLITLKVSSPTITMPNVVGQNKTQASSILASKNLTPNFVEQDSDQPPGTVLSSDPAAGGQVPKLPQGGRPTVTVNVAREPKVPVPDVAGQNAFAALTTLQQAGFQVTAVETPSDTVPKGTAIGTDPPAGTPVDHGAALTLQVSSGPSTVAMPPVVGQPRATAEALLNTTLQLGVQVQFANAGASKKGLVVAQNPPAGTQVPKGSTVVIVVGL
jgi:beta-lactam-binding protein with PASTA domain